MRCVICPAYYGRYACFRACHGSFHDAGDSGGCLYFEPNRSTSWCTASARSVMKYSSGMAWSRNSCSSTLSSRNTTEWYFFQSLETKVVADFQSFMGSAPLFYIYRVGDLAVVMAGEHQREADLTQRNGPHHQTKSLEVNEEKELKPILACH
jgi:hypothetical protein